ncbi:MAG: hypothetical protein RI935_389 [Candidatus Parcubacteria bacterium]|jgi:hypothetical protein
MITGTMMFVGLLVWALLSFVVYACYVLAIAFTLWMVVDAAKMDRFLWVVLIVGVPVIGPVVYFFVEKKKEYKRVPKLFAEKKEGEEEEYHEKASNS